MTRDRMHSDEFLLTQEFLAMMLGVRRSASVAASALQRAGIISYKRRSITILDMAELKRRSCECYEITKREFDRLLGVGSQPDIALKSKRLHAVGAETRS